MYPELDVCGAQPGSGAGLSLADVPLYIICCLSLEDRAVDWNFVS